MSQTILDQIITHKKLEVELQKMTFPVTQLLQLKRMRPHYSLVKNLNISNASGIIAEFKRKSPSKNWIKQEANVTEITAGYEQAGASGLSILTDNHFFGGTIDDLISAAEQVKLPILRKDFMIDEYQVIEAAKMGADVILLIAAVLSPQQVSQMAHLAHQNNLEVLLEIHNHQELDCLCDAVDLVGVNNRDLHTFKTSIQTSSGLSRLIPERFIRISESGINSPDDVRYLRNFGYKGFLIGESFMRTENPGTACATFIQTIRP